MDAVRKECDEGEGTLGILAFILAVGVLLMLALA